MQMASPPQAQGEAGLASTSRLAAVAAGLEEALRGTPTAARQLERDLQQLEPAQGSGQAGQAGAAAGAGLQQQLQNLETALGAAQARKQQLEEEGELLRELVVQGHQQARSLVQHTAAQREQLAAQRLALQQAEQQLGELLALLADVRLENRALQQAARAGARCAVVECRALRESTRQQRLLQLLHS